MAKYNTAQSILIVEDDRSIAENLAEILELSGFPCRVASTPEAAMEAMQQDDPLLVLMDLNLGASIDGVELARRMQQVRRFPLVYLTAYSSRDVVERARRTNPVGYLLKPFHLREVLIAIEIGLATHSQREELEQRIFRMDQAMANIHESIIFTDGDARILALNPQAVELLGYPDDAIGASLFQLLRVVDQNRQPILPEVLRSASPLGEAPYRCQGFCIDQSGVPVPMQIAVSKDVEHEEFSLILQRLSHAVEAESRHALPLSA